MHIYHLKFLRTTRVISSKMSFL